MGIAETWFACIHMMMEIRRWKWKLPITRIGYSMNGVSKSFYPLFFSRFGSFFSFLPRFEQSECDCNPFLLWKRHIETGIYILMHFLLLLQHAEYASRRRESESLTMIDDLWKFTPTVWKIVYGKRLFIYDILYAVRFENIIICKYKRH